MFVRRKGFTLIEVVAAVVMMTVSLVAIMQMFTVVSRSQEYKRCALIASNLAQAKMEEVIAVKRNNFSAFVEDNIGSSYTNFPNYTLYVHETSSWKGNAYLSKIDVKVEGASRSGMMIDETISRAIADY